MVWGIMRQSGLGDYFPPAEFVGWKEAAEAYYNTDMPEAEKIALKMQDRVSFLNFILQFDDDRGPVAPQVLPREIRLDRTERNLASLLMLGVLSVDEPLMNIIESLEPGVHQFWPMKVCQPKGDDFPKKFYGIVIRRFLKSFRPEDSNKDSFNSDEVPSGKPFYYARGASKASCGGLAMSRDIIGSAHLWREEGWKNPNVFMSDELQAAIQNAGLRIPKHYKLKAV
jgi:hypothetical protein